MTCSDRVMDSVRASPGRTDREIANALFGPGHPQQGVNQAASARRMAAAGRSVREIAKVLGCSPDTAHRAIRGQR